MLTTLSAVAAQADEVTSCEGDAALDLCGLRFNLHWGRVAVLCNLNDVGMLPEHRSDVEKHLGAAGPPDKRPEIRLLRLLTLAIEAIDGVFEVHDQRDPKGVCDCGLCDDCWGLCYNLERAQDLLEGRLALPPEVIMQLLQEHEADVPVVVGGALCASVPP
jgi:hypothetical protein